MSIAVPDQDIWRAVAGPSVKIPAVNSYVYYFPQGHLENSSSGVEYNNYNGDSTSIPCRVISLSFLSTSSTDECFVKIQLQPVAVADIRTVNENEDENDNNDQTDISYFPKVLSVSDANKSKGLVVPCSCADSIFPKLNLSDNLPAQRLSIRDTHNNAWEFHHVYRGTPGRHLFTTASWNKFVTSKGLEHGDSVVFMKRKSTTEGLFIGIRRKSRVRDHDDENNRIQAAIENAAKGRVFEVDYYPRFGSQDFVVSAGRVRRSISIQWRAGMRVKILVLTDDTGQTKWNLYEETIGSVNFQSPWRMLQVNWDISAGILKDLNRISPWEVAEITSPSYKRSKLSQIPPMGSVLDSVPTFNNPPFSLTVERDDSHHQLFPKRPARRVGKEPETVSPAPNTIGSSNNEQYSSTNVQRGQNSSTGEDESVMLFGTNLREPENPIEGGGSRNGESDVRTEEVQPNSSPDRVG